ncbi:MAG: hypothetical protein ACE5MB_07790 [Anaerolineae bacterium]
MALQQPTTPQRPVTAREHQVTYAWYLSDGSTYVGPSGNAAVPIPVQPGEDVTVTVSVDTPTSPGFYVLRWDMRRQEWGPFTQQWDWVSFSDSDWPTQDQAEWTTPEEPPERDHLYLRLRDPEGNILTTLETISNRSTKDTWMLSTFDLTPYVGQAIQVYFEAITGGSLSHPFTDFYVDDVSLQACD